MARCRGGSVIPTERLQELVNLQSNVSYLDHYLRSGLNRSVPCVGDFHNAKELAQDVIEGLKLLLKTK